MGGGELLSLLGTHGGQVADPMIEAEICRWSDILIDDGGCLCEMNNAFWPRVSARC